MTEWPRISWVDAEPRRLEIERAAMPSVASGLTWTGAGWAGTAPLWPFTRPAPPKLTAYVGGRQLTMEIAYPEAFPMVPPRFVPIDPEPDIRVRSMHAWHVNGDGSLCLFQSAHAWDPACTAADLIPKASGWFLEYLLLEDGRIEQMTVNGIVNDDNVDHVLVP